ncbi:MAG: sensor histidine kinase [Granulosicoccus sp.]
MSATLTAPGILRGLSHKWSAMSLVRRFTFASFLILLIGMVSTAAWVSNRIEKGVVSNSALSAALFMDSFIAPLLQGIDKSQKISDNSREVLSQLIDHSPLGEQVLSYKIWGKDGIVLHGSNVALIGERFPVTTTLSNAWAGAIQAEFDKLHDAEDVLERAFNVPLLEIYSPIRNNAGKVIAVSEFYANAEQLEKDLFLTGLQSWMLFGVAGLTMFAALSGIALQGSRTIERQQNALKKRVAELSDLRKRLQHASRRSTELNEIFLRKVGADLHDGPAQLIAFALLKIEELTSESKSAADKSAVGRSIKEPLQDALSEIRNLSGGLMLPGFDGLTTRAVLEKAADSHARRTSVHVHRNIDQAIDEVKFPQSILICMYRFVQETLNNSFRHGGTDEVFLSAKLCRDCFTATVADNGLGFIHAIIERDNNGLGLQGLRERIESVGGTFIVKSNPGEGTSVCVSFTVDTHQEAVK